MADLLKRLDEAAARSIWNDRYGSLANAGWEDAVGIASAIPDGTAAGQVGDMRRNGEAARKAILAEIEEMGFVIIPAKPPQCWGDNEANLYEGLIAAAIRSAKEY